MPRTFATATLTPRALDAVLGRTPRGPSTMRGGKWDTVLRVVGPYLAAPAGWPPHTVVERADGETMAVRTADLQIDGQ